MRSPHSLSWCTHPSVQDGSAGQLGNRETKWQWSPVLVSGGRSWVAVSAGSEHTCAITQAGSMWCWGKPLFNGQAAQTLEPAEVGGGHTFVAASAGWDRTCGLDAAGDVWCFGAHGWLQSPLRTPGSVARSAGCYYLAGT